MNRRKLLSLIGGAAACPVAARAQQGERVRRIGVLGSASNDPFVQAELRAFREALEKLGWMEGRNLRIDYRWAMGDAEAARAGAAELVALAPDAIVVNPVVGLAALQGATRTIPVVFTVVAEPVAQGFVANLAHPGANITGFSNLEPSVGGKWLQLLKEVAPQISRVAVIGNPETAPFNVAFARAAETVARSLSVEVTSAPVHSRSDIETVLTILGREPGGGLITVPDPFNTANRDFIIELATRHRVPAIYNARAFVTAGGLASYGIDQLYRQAAGYVDRILRGEKAADLPVQEPTQFDLVINLKTAKTLGLTIPPSLLAIADEVIE